MISQSNSKSFIDFSSDGDGDGGDGGEVVVVVVSILSIEARFVSVVLLE